MAVFAWLVMSLVEGGFATVIAAIAVITLWFIASDIVPCKNRVFSHATIWVGVPAVTTGLRSTLVLPLMLPYTIELMKFTRASVVLVLKMANSGPFSVVCGIRLAGGKKLKTLPELKMSCDIPAPLL